MPITAYMGKMTTAPILCADLISVDFDEIMMLAMVIMKDNIGLRIKVTINHSSVGSGTNPNLI